MQSIFTELLCIFVPEQSLMNYGVVSALSVLLSLRKRQVRFAADMLFTCIVSIHPPGHILNDDYTYSNIAELTTAKYY